MSRTLVIAGGTGLLGQHLIEHLGSAFTDIIVLSRGKAEDLGIYRTVQWDAVNQGPWVNELKKATVLINLTGKSIQCRFTEENKKLLISSRVDSTRALGRALKENETNVKLWLNASGSAIYPQSWDIAQDEGVEKIGQSFLSILSKSWEDAFYEEDLPLRRVAMRITPVLDREEGAFPPLRLIANTGLGGPQGNGKQMMSWIHIDDFCRAVAFLIEKEDIRGPVNLSSPNARSNASFMRALRKAVGMPIGLPAPAFAIQIGSRFTGVDPSLILDSRFLSPALLIQEGFTFEKGTLELAFEDLLK